MKANLPKMSKPPLCLKNLSEREKKLLELYYTNYSYDISDKRSAQLQEVWIKLACINLHNMGLSADAIMEFIGAWKRLYKTVNKIGDDQKVQDFLKEKVNQIFGVGGFPQDFIDDIKGQ